MSTKPIKILSLATALAALSGTAALVSPAFYWKRKSTVMWKIAGLVGIALSSVVCASPSADAMCRWTFNCTGGPCRQVQICHSTIDMPAIRPPAIPPIVSPAIPPIPTPMVPPIGTSSCSPAYLCNAFGQCSWRTTCR